MVKKWLKSSMVSLVLICIVFSIFGCSDKKRTQTTSDVVEVRFGWPGGGDSFERLKGEIIPAFEKANPEIKIKLEYQPWHQFFTKLKTQIAAGDAPDFWLSDGVYVMEFADRGALLDLTELVKSDFDFEKYFALDFAKDAKGRIWGVPRELQPVALYYNKTLFDQAGLTYPDETWDWEMLLESSKRLTKYEEGSKKIKQYGFMSDNWISGGWFNFIYQNQGQVLDQTKRKSMLNQPEAIEAVEFMVDLIHKHKVSPPLEIAESQGGKIPVFQTGVVAMMINNYATSASLNQAKDLDYDVAVLPKGRTRAAGYNANPFVINSKATKAKAEAAWRFIKYFASSKTIQQMQAESGSGVPILKEVVYSDSFVDSKGRPQNKTAFIDSLEEGYALPMDLNKCWNEWRTALTDDLSLAWLGKTSSKEAMLKAHKDVQVILDRSFASK